MTTEPDRPVLPPSLAANPHLGDWLRISPDGTVEVRTGKVEIGQGLLTALAQVTAEELDIDVSRIRMTAARTALSPNEGYTAGSLSVQHSGAALRIAGAEARAIYLEAAATRWGLSPEALTVSDGRIDARDGRSTTYWELADDALLDRPATGLVQAKSPTAYRLVSTCLPRIDLPDKLTAHPRFAHDLRPAGLLFGRVVRPPTRGAELLELDTAPAVAMPGVISVVRDGDFIGVIAEREETALRAADRVRADAAWKQEPALPDEHDLPAFVTSQPAETT